MAVREVVLQKEFEASGTAWETGTRGQAMETERERSVQNRVSRKE